MPTFIMDNDRSNFDYHPTRWRWETFFFYFDSFLLFLLGIYNEMSPMSTAALIATSPHNNEILYLFFESTVDDDHGSLSFGCHLTTREWGTFYLLFLLIFYKKFIITRYLQWNDANDYRGWRHLWFPPRPTPWQWKGFLFFFCFLKFIIVVRCVQWNSIKDYREPHPSR